MTTKTAKTAIVTGCDHKYYPMLRELIHSIKSFPQSQGMDIVILDAGLTAEQRRELKPLVQDIREPEWPAAIPARKIRGRTFLKACVCRPFLPEIFPGYETYFWLDADTWIQSWAGPEWLLKGAESGKISLAGQVDRGYPRAARVKWLWRWPWKVRSFYFSNANRAFGFGTAKALLPCHVLQAGAFVLRADAPHWKRWQELAVQAVKKGKIFTAEQLSLGVLCHREGYEFEMLPAWTHWLCEFKPLWDPQKGMFVEPFLPRMELGIIHLSGLDEMRLDRGVTTDFRTTDGRIVHKSYRYPQFDAAEAA